MVSIDVDFEVFKELTMRRRSEDMSYDDVIRELLGLPQLANGSVPHLDEPSGIPWVVKGVSFPHGTEFKATYKGQLYKGQVRNGALVVKGTRYTSPSAAAVSITGSPVNGWMFWECQLPGDTRWRVIKSCRDNSV